MAIRVLDLNGNELCRWTMPDDVLALHAGGLHAILTEDGAGALLLNTPIGSQLRLPVPEAAKERLQSGGTFVVEMKALDANGFTQKMAAAYGASEARRRETEEGLAKSIKSLQESLAERTDRVNELERSFLYRLARRFR